VHIPSPEGYESNELPVAKHFASTIGRRLQHYHMSRAQLIGRTLPAKTYKKGPSDLGSIDNFANYNSIDRKKHYDNIRLRMHLHG
jgi:hypothetical protein